MKKAFILLFLIGLYFTSFGQLAITDISGKWKVEKVVGKPTNRAFKPLLAGYKSSTFIFNEDETFILSNTVSSEMFDEVLSVTKDTKWKFDDKKQRIRIGNKSDKYSLIAIAISEKDGKMLFEILESGIILQMIKVE